MGCIIFLSDLFYIVLISVWLCSRNLLTTYSVYVSNQSESDEKPVEHLSTRRCQWVTEKSFTNKTTTHYRRAAAKRRVWSVMMDYLRLTLQSAFVENLEFEPKPFYCSGWRVLHYIQSTWKKRGKRQKRHIKRQKFTF